LLATVYNLFRRLTLVCGGGGGYWSGIEYEIVVYCKSGNVNAQKAPAGSSRGLRCGPRPSACGPCVSRLPGACRPFQSRPI